MLHFNELSFHGQFPGSLDVALALRRILAMRQRASAADRALRVTRAVADRPVIGDHPLRAALGGLEEGLRRATLIWLDRSGPFWDGDDSHPDEWFECQQELVTGSGVAEAAYQAANSHDSALVSARPSGWERPMLQVMRGGENESTRATIAVPNFIDLEPLAAWLACRQPPLTSWSMLVVRAKARFPRLRFATDVVAALDAHPFHAGAADAVLERLAVLDRLASLVDATTGAMQPEGVALLQTHFVGDKAWFSDSSDAEKDRFRNELTFRQPGSPGSTIFATWHGKVKISQLRIHYDHSFRADAPVDVVYIGPKITKR